MSKQPPHDPLGNHSVQIGGGVAGSLINTGDLTVNQFFASSHPVLSDFSTEQLRVAFHECGALLRDWKYTIANTGKHIRRRVVEDIIEWVQTDEADLQINGQMGNVRVGVLLDQAGMGKTTVARDVTLALEGIGWAVLAIKADQQLSGLSSLQQIPELLGLPDMVENIVVRLAKEQPVAIVIDQIDALSLSLSHDQRALDITLGMVARLKDIPNVRVLISWRTFDLHSDPHLHKFTICRHFALPVLDVNDAQSFVKDCGFQWGQLSPATQELLLTPLHLDLFVMALESQGAPNGADRSVADVGYGVTTLQDLYRLLWENVIRRDDAGAPSIAARENAVEQLAQQFMVTRKTSAPKSFSSRLENAHLEGAVRWLASAGILVDAGQDWGFLHQTFIDYCAAKSFVESGADLTATILSGDQGLLARPQLLQTIAYLRGSQTHRDEYLQQLQALFAAPDLREHLRVLLFGWFGALRNPDDNEWRLALRVLRQPEHRAQLLGWMGANPVWFARVRETLLPAWMETEDEFLEQSVMSYLRSLGGVSQQEVATLMAPFVGRNSAWDQRIFAWISDIRDWQSKQAVNLFEKVMTSRINDALSRNQKFSIGHIWSLQNLIEYDLLAGCRVLVSLLDGLLAIHRAHPREPRYPDIITTSSYVSTITLAERLDELNSNAVRELLNKLPKEASEAFLDAILPWIEEAIRPDTSDPEDELYHRYNYRHDGLYDLWHGGRRCVRHLIAQSVASALVEIASSDRANFNATVARIASWECLTPHQILVNAFQSAPELLADEAARYLLDDRRRLDIGDRKAFDSRRLISLICPHLDQSRRDELQNFIILCSWNVQRWRGHQNHLLEYRGSDELLLLEAFPSENRNAPTRATVRELRAKFPDLEANKSPTIFGVSRFPEPLTLKRALKISDRAWIRLFQSLGKTPSSNPTRDQERRLRGLSGALVNSIVIQPDRFYRLMHHLKATEQSEMLALNHRQAFIEGFAGATVPLESRPKWVASEPEDEPSQNDHVVPTMTAPLEWFFEAVRLFAPLPGVQGYTPDNNYSWRETRWRIAHHLEQYADVLPADLMDLLESYVRTLPFGDLNPRDSFEKEREKIATQSAQDSRNAVCNHERARALRVLMGALDRAPSSGQTRRWDLLEFVTTDPSPILRLGAIEELSYFVADFPEKTMDLFEALLDGHPELIRAYDTREFLYYAMNGQLQRLLPHIEELMNQLGEPENVSATDDSGDVAPQTVRIGEASWSNKMVRWDSADARNRTQSDEECGQSGAELVALAALFVPMQKEVQEEIARLVAQCLEGPAPWRCGVARVAISNLESKNAATCLQWLGNLLHDPDEKVRHMVGQFFLYAAQKKVKLPDEAILEFARAFAAAPALVNGLDGWRDYLQVLRQEYPDKVLPLLEAMMDNPHRSESRLFYTEDWMRIALHIHADPLCSPESQTRALSIFDKLTRENSGVAHQLLTEWDRR